MEQIICPGCRMKCYDNVEYCPKCGYNIAAFMANPDKLFEYAYRLEFELRYAEALPLYKHAAKLKHAESMYRLGMIYENGKPNVEKNLKNAEYCHTKAAELYYIPSIKWLINAYITGKIPNQKENGITLLKDLALNGDRSSINKLISLGIIRCEADLKTLKTIEQETDQESEIADFSPDLEFGSHNIVSQNGSIVKKAFNNYKKTTQTQDNIINEEKEHLKMTLDAMNKEIDRLIADDYDMRKDVNYNDSFDMMLFGEENKKKTTKKYFLNLLKARLKNPYFARLELFDEIDNVESAIYIGQDNITIDGKPYVYSHNSPVGNKVYSKINGHIEGKEYKYKVIFRRKIYIEKGQLLKVYQDFTYGDDENKNIVYDEFLAKILEKKKNDIRLTDIISSIQENQNQIIIRPLKENLIVQGCAGSGKTMILLQRLEYLYYNNQIKSNDSLILGPTAEFRAHIRPVCEDLRITDSTIHTVSEYYSLKIVEYNYKYKNKYSNATFLKDDLFNGDIAQYYYSDKFYSDAKIICEEIKDSYDTKVLEFKKAHKEWELKKNSYSTLKKFFNDKPPVPPLKPEISIDGQKFVSIKKKTKLKTTEFYKCELYATLLLNYLVFGDNPITPTKVLFIDEGQDISIAEYKLISSINKNRVIFNIFGDTNQVISEIGIKNWNELDSVGNFNEYELNENYRNTQEITKFINKELDYTATPLGLQGNMVMTTTFKKMQLELSQKQTDRVAIIYSSKNNALIELLEKSNLKDYAYTVELSKGLEFEKVFVFDKDMNKNEKYIAYSRALTVLKLVK